MPVKVSWGKYIMFATCAMLSMFAGSEVVHRYYQPLTDLDEYVKKEKQKYKL